MMDDEEEIEGEEDVEFTDDEEEIEGEEDVEFTDDEEEFEPQMTDDEPQEEKILRKSNYEGFTFNIN